MNQYCYNIITELKTPDAEKIKKHIGDIYRKKKFKDLAFGADEKLPFLVIYSQKDSQVCVKMTSKAKKNIERLEGIHGKLKAADLKVDEEITLEKPYLFELEQCAWWDTDCKIGQGKKWSTLAHNGPYFTHIQEPYEPHGAPLIYDGEEYDLSPKEERIASFYARRIISENSGNVTQLWTKDKVFNNNFWTDFKKYLTPAHKKVFKDFKKLDFSAIVERLEELKELDKQISQKEKDLKKIKVAEKKQNYGYAMINGIREPLGNFTIEPAAIFYGRGDNPHRGKIKRDIEPEEVTINIGEKAEVPKPPKGHKWKEVLHDHNLAWVASWKDPISNENKYVYFAAEGQLKGKSDYFKYEKARKLNKFLEKVRARYTKDIKSKDEKKRQLGTVLYLIDNHGIRVGNEKDESETDTVGASTLRVEHVKLQDPDTVIFDFLGKDSIRYYKEIPVDEEVYDNFGDFLNGKNPGDPVFDRISAADINNYLKTFDGDFSAKVFRTRLASTVMDEALKGSKVKKNATQDDKKKIFTKANIEVARLLNHQRTVSEKAKETIIKYQEELKELRKQLKDAKESGKSTKTLETRIRKKTDQIAAKKDTLNVAINTSLMNYIDPRIVVSWSKSNEMNIPKAYSATLQRKFKWAIDMTDEDWDYEETPLVVEMAKLKPIDLVTSKPAAKKPSNPVAKKSSNPVKKPVAKKSSKPIAKPVAKKSSNPVKNPVAKKSSKSPTAGKKGVELVSYSEKSIAVIGDTKPIRDALKEAGGKFNPNLTIDGKKVPGWIFSKKKQAVVEELLNPETKGWESVMTDYNLTPKARNIIKCFARDEKVVQFLKQEVTGYNDRKIYSQEYLARFLTCLDTFNKDRDTQIATLEGYMKESYTVLAKEITSRMAPSTVPTYMFLIYILYKVSSRMREEYLNKLMKHLSETSEIQKCLCDNSESETIVSGDLISEVPMKNLYLLPSGRCVEMDDLILHLKTSDNKVADPTWTDTKKKAPPIWTNGWELRALIDRITAYNPTEGAAIKNQFKDVTEKIVAQIPEKTKQLIKETYPLFYFPEATSKKQIVDGLVKYGYGDLKKSSATAAAGDAKNLDEFRTMLGFKIAHHILEELDPKSREAVIFAGEYVGLGKEAWGKLTTGDFCTKTYGTLLHRLSGIV